MKGAQCVEDSLKDYHCKKEVHLLYHTSTHLCYNLHIYHQWSLQPTDCYMHAYACINYTYLYCYCRLYQYISWYIRLCKCVFHLNVYVHIVCINSVICYSCICTFIKEQTCIFHIPYNTGYVADLFSYHITKCTLRWPTSVHSIYYSSNFLISLRST